MTKRRPVMIGIDPGKTVGIATYVAGRFTELQLPVVDALPWIEGWLTEMAGSGCPVIDVAIERFTRGSASGHHTSVQGDADDVIARVVGLCGRELCLWTRVYLQSAGEAKATVTDRRLKQAGWHVPGHRHAMDAARHLGFRMLAEYPREYYAVMAGMTLIDNVPVVD
jgi:hypothetical protein